MLSSLVRPIRVLDASRLEIRLWWDNITPFGCPVVPEVYTIIATWDSSRRSRGQAVVSSAHISWRRLKLRCPSLQPCSRYFSHHPLPFFVGCDERLGTTLSQDIGQSLSARKRRHVHSLSAALQNAPKKYDGGHRIVMKNGDTVSGANCEAMESG